jgi:hypothetical protein
MLYVCFLPVKSQFIQSCPNLATNNNFTRLKKKISKTDQKIAPQNTKQRFMSLIYFRMELFVLIFLQQNLV